MKRLMCISTGCFHSRHVKKEAPANEKIKLCSKLDVDGIELIFAHVEHLANFKLNKESVNILKNMKFNTIHLPFYQKIKKSEDFIFNDSPLVKRVMNKAYRLYDQIDAKNIVIHSNLVKNYELFDVLNYQHSIENMEFKHHFKISDYSKILKENPSFKMVFDTTHAGEGKEMHTLIKNFKNKMIYCHLSSNYFNHLHIPFHVLNKEYLKPFEPIKKLNMPVILESQIGAKTINEYKKEVDFVRKWLRC